MDLFLVWSKAGETDSQLHLTFSVQGYTFIENNREIQKKMHMLIQVVSTM